MPFVSVPLGRAPVYTSLCLRQAYQTSFCKATLKWVYNDYMTRNCKRCSEPIPETKRSDATYCSTKCKKAVEYKNYYKPRLTVREHTKCLNCKGPIPETTKLNAKHCSRKCKLRLHRKNHNRNRDHLRRSNVGYVPFSHDEWLSLLRRNNYACAYCDRKTRLERDHVIPLSRGGRHAIANVLPCCRKCNMSKKDKLLSEWRITKNCPEKMRLHIVKEFDSLSLPTTT